MAGTVGAGMMAARLADIPAAMIRLTVANPRSDGDADLAGLTAALKSGLAQRPTLVEVEAGVFEVLLGERRVRAMLAANWPTIPALIDDALNPLDAHTRRVMENLHRRDLGPIDEARALKIGWLGANAAALGLREEANHTIRDAADRDGLLSALMTLLNDADWSVSRPTVTQDEYLAGLGLGLSKAALRKKLQVLNLDATVQQQAQQSGMTAAAIRAVMRLDVEDQQALMSAVDNDPGLSRNVRTIVEGVQKKGRTVEDAVAIARGQVPGMLSSHDFSSTEAASSPSDFSEGDSCIDYDTIGAHLLELAERLAQIQHDLGSRGLRAVPAPYDALFVDALLLITETCTTLHA